MVRSVAIYEPENRAAGPHSLYCCHCGNTTQWQIDLRLRHQIASITSGLAVSLDTLQTRKILKAIENNLITMVDRSLYKEKNVFQCANCQNAWIDFHERIIDSCLWSGCPGCFHCGNWIDREEMLEMCSECLEDRKGDVDEDYCDSGYCHVSDFGLSEVMQHHGTNLKEIKEILEW